MAPTDDSVSLREYIELWQREHAELHRIAQEHATALIATATTALDHRLDNLNGLHAEMRNDYADFAPRALVERLDNELRGLPNAYAALAQVERLDADTDRRFLEMGTELAVLRSQNDRLQGIVGVARFLGFGGLATAAGALILAFSRGTP